MDTQVSVAEPVAEAGLQAHVAVEAQAQAEALATVANPASADTGGGGGHGSRSSFDTAAYEAKQAAFVRQQDRKQISALVLASIVAASPNGSLATAAEQAVTAAEALLDRLDR